MGNYSIPRVAPCLPACIIPSRRVPKSYALWSQPLRVAHGNMHLTHVMISQIDHVITREFAGEGSKCVQMLRAVGTSVAYVSAHALHL